jgi:hypothetical protein
VLASWTMPFLFLQRRSFPFFSFFNGHPFDFVPLFPPTMFLLSLLKHVNDDDDHMLSGLFQSPAPARWLAGWL